MTLGYKATLDRGYAIVRGDGAIVTTAKAASKADVLEIEFADKKMTVGSKSAKPSKPSPKPAGTPTDQGSLF
jgi:exodeoxyribonuclease VII large subunit